MQPTFNFVIPTLYREFDGKKYIYCGQYPKRKKLIEDLKHTMFKNGYYLKIQRASDSDVIIWSRPRWE